MNRIIQIRLMVIGSSRSGKKSWLRRLHDDRFDPNQYLCLSRVVRTLTISSSKVKFEISLQDSEDRTRYVLPRYDAVIYMYDQSNEKSRQQAIKFAQEYMSYPEMKPCIWVGSKSDLPTAIQADLPDGLPHISMSSTTGSNIYEPLRHLATLI